MEQFYDSTQPHLIPAGASAALYYDGRWAAGPADAARFARVRWITVLGDYAHCGIADYEGGNKIFGPGLLRRYVAGRQAMGKRARVYCDRDNIPRVHEELDGHGLTWEWFISTLDQDRLHKDYLPGMWGVQFDGGPEAGYDTSVLYGEW